MLSEETMKGKVLLAHPGTQYAPNLARELGSRDVLGRFWTGFAISKQSFVGSSVRYLPFCIYRKMQNRLVDIDTSLLRTMPLLEWKRKRVISTVGEEEAYFERNRHFQEAIPDSELLNNRVVVGFDTSAWILGERARRMDKVFILDQSIGHPVAKERIYQNLRSRFPNWSASAPRKTELILSAEKSEHDLADMIVVPSDFVKRTLIEYGVVEEKIFVIPFGTDISLFRPAENRRRLQNQKVVFLYVGGLTARKGVPLLLQAWRTLGLQDAELWLVGSGDIPAEERANLPASVQLLGIKCRTEVAQIMQRADVFVFPSFFEGLAQVQIEALASGLPVIGTVESGADQILESGVNGVVIEAGNQEELASCMHDLACNDALRVRMQDATRSRRNSLSWETYGNKWLSLLSRT